MTTEKVKKLKEFNMFEIPAPPRTSQRGLTMPKTEPAAAVKAEAKKKEADDSDTSFLNVLYHELCVDDKITKWEADEPGNTANLDGVPSVFNHRTHLKEMDFLPPSTVSIAKELQAIRKAIQAPKKELEDKRKKKKQERKRGKSEESAAEKRIRNSSPTDGNEKENWRTSWDNKLTRKRPLEPNHTENNAVNRDPRLRVKSNEQLGFGPTKVKPTLAVDTDSDEECVYLRDDQRRFNVVKHKLFQVDELPVPQPATEKLTEAEKRQLAMSRAEKVLKLFEQKRTGAQEDEFFMVNTIRKVPESDSRMRQKAVKNASSLCRNQNVDYEFNSVPGTQIDLVKWGLETVPNSTRDLLQLMPLDVDHLKQAGLKTQPSQPILKLKQEQLFNAPSELEDSDSLLINAGTQTDVKPHMESVGTQVKLTGQPIGPFWHDIHFDPTVLTRTQLYYIFSLKQLMRTQPSHAEAARIYKVLQTALDIQREYHPRN